MFTDPLSFLADFLSTGMQAAVAGQWSLVAMLALIIAVAYGRKWLAPKIPALATDAGAMGFTLLLGTLGGVATVLLSGGNPLSLALFVASLKVTIASAGGYVAIKKALWPLLLHLLSKYGAKIPLVGGVLAAVAARYDAPTVIAKAVQAGSAAVLGAPSAGMPKAREVK